MAVPMARAARVPRIAIACIGCVLGLARADAGMDGRDGGERGQGRGRCGRIARLRAAPAPGTCTALPSLTVPCPHGPAEAMADEPGHLPRRPARVLAAARWSLQGLAAAWYHESSFRLEVYLFVILAPLAWWLGATGVERVLLIAPMVLVLVIELLNSAVEAVIERYGPEQHELAGRAKDMGSAAVFLAMLLVVLSWAALLWPRLAP